MPRKLNHLVSLALSAALAGAVTGCSSPMPTDPPGPPAPSVTSGPPATDPPEESGGPLTPPPPDSVDPWLLTTDGIGPYRIGQRIDAMPAGIFGESSPVDAGQCPELYTRGATGIYAGTLLFVVRHNVLVEISTGGGDPGAHTTEGDRVGTPWSTAESRHAPTAEAPGTWKTNPAGQRAFVVSYGDRVILFGINPIRPRAIGSVTAGLTDHSEHTFLTGAPC
jgi:hypothetical protein